MIRRIDQHKTLSGLRSIEGLFLPSDVGWAQGEPNVEPRIQVAPTRSLAGDLGRRPPVVAAIPLLRPSPVSALVVETLIQKLVALVWTNVAGRLRLLTDLATLVSCLVFANWLTHPTAGLMAETLWLGGTLGALWTLAVTVIHHYEQGRKRSAVDDVAIVSLLVCGIGTAVALVGHLGPPPGSTPTAGEFLLVFWPAALAARLLSSCGSYRHDHEPDLQQVLIVGTGSLARMVAEDLRQVKALQLVGLLPLSGEAAAVVRGLPVFDRSITLEQVLRQHPVTEVYLTGSAPEGGVEIQSAIATCERFGVPFALPACGFRLDRAEATNLRTVALNGFVHYSCVRPKPIQLAIKRVIDILAAAAALLILSPLLAVAALLVKATSRGPVFFRQVRSGLHGSPFHMLKFRSMVLNAEQAKGKLQALNEQSGPVFKIRHDPRVTWIGRFLRKHSIDELPQLVNVLRGEMSLVGPRPPVPEEVRKYEAWQRRRLSVRPGLTCVWQVSGRNELSFDQWMYLDMQYIDNWKLSHDLRLILRTLPVVLTGRGAS